MRVHAPWGLFGGEPAASARYILDPEGEGRELPSKFTIDLAPDAVMSYRTPGGGGYGPPFERSPEAVREDVMDGKVTADRADAAYGVIVDAATGRIDVEATARRREGGRE